MAKKDYVVLNARLGSSEGGIACGPVGGADVGEIEFIEEHDYRAVGHSQYMAFVLVDGNGGVVKDRIAHHQGSAGKVT